MTTTYVSKFLGHQHLSTTTRYLNTTLRELHRSLEEVEKARLDPSNLASCLQTPTEAPSEPNEDSDEETPSKSLVS